MAIPKQTNKIFAAGVNVLEQWEESKSLQKLRTLLKNYLELDNVSFLFGAGSSIVLGSISIATIPKIFEEAIKQIPNKLGDATTNAAYNEFLEIVKSLQNTSAVKRQTWEENGKTIEGNIDYPLESLLNTMIAIEFLQNSSHKNLINRVYISDILSTLKHEVFKSCDVDQLPLNERGLTSDEIKNLRSNRYFFHEKFTKKILQRPLNLKRVNIFTTNYDMAFDTAFDRLGVHFINGFSGFHKRTFKPETYEYDLFFPGSTTQGRVTRIEKVLKYYKIHGSLTWVQTESASDNVYGIEEIPLELIKSKKEFNKLMIYPSAAKKSYTLDFPYSELFRQFAATITQQQSVLITFGYSFSDEHINDIIYQALTIPSFTLIIIDFNGTKNKEIERLNSLKDPRIIIIEGQQLGSLPFFVESVLPDFIEENIHEKVSQTLRELYDQKPSHSSPIAGNPVAEELVPKPQEQATLSTSTDPIDDLPF